VLVAAAYLHLSLTTRPDPRDLGRAMRELVFIRDIGSALIFSRFLAVL